MLPITGLFQKKGQKMKVWKKIIHANRNKKKPGLALLISKKCILKQRLKKDKEHYIMIK